MKCADLATPYPTVRLDTSAAEAARLLTEHGRPALLVVDERDHPVAVLPALQLLRLVVPVYIQDDPALARVVDDDFAETVGSQLEGRTVRQLLPKSPTPLVVAKPEDNLLELASIMLTENAPLVAVVDGPDKESRLVGAITVAQVLAGVLP